GSPTADQVSILQQHRSSHQHSPAPELRRVALLHTLHSQQRRHQLQPNPRHRHLSHQHRPEPYDYQFPGQRNRRGNRPSKHHHTPEIQHDEHNGQSRYDLHRNNNPWGYEQLLRLLHIPTLNTYYHAHLRNGRPPMADNNRNNRSNRSSRSNSNPSSSETKETRGRNTPWSRIRPRATTSPASYTRRTPSATRRARATR